MNFRRAIIAGLFCFTVSATASAQQYYIYYYPTNNANSFAQPYSAPTVPSTSGLRDRATYSQTGMSRQTIQSMDILSRPNRVGHFYGNTVRRRHHRRRGY